MQSAARSIVPTMTGLSRSERAGGGRGSQAPGGRRAGVLSRASFEARSEEQEAEVRAQLYARPAEPERMVRRVGPIARNSRFQSAEAPEPAGELLEERPAA
jgi:hypothetical protein